MLGIFSLPLESPMRTLFCALALVLASVGAGSAELGPAPSWELNDLEGQPRRLEEWRGRWVLLKLGTTQCPNCTQELEELAGIEGDLTELGVEVLDIYLREDRYTVQKYWKKKTTAYRPTILYDYRGGLVRLYGVSMIPHLFLVNPEGRIVWEARYTPAPALLAALREQVDASN